MVGMMRRKHTDRLTCGRCGYKWCGICDATPADLCPACHGAEVSECRVDRIDAMRYPPHYGAAAGALRAFTMVGSYPVFYLDTADSVLCADCATESHAERCDVVAAGVNWEDELLYCDDCGDRIECAYPSGDKKSP